MSATVEWVETSGKTVEEAKEAALDRLGVDETEAEFEVLEEPRAGLFGRTRGAGRVRARILPRTPRPKQERRRRGKDSSSDGARDAGGRKKKAGSGSGSGDGGRSERSGDRTRSTGGGDLPDSGEGPRGGGSRAGGPRGDGSRGDGSRAGGQTAAKEAGQERNKERESMDAAEQTTIVTAFLDGLGAAFGLDVSSTATMDGDVLRASIEGSEVGLFIGPRLGTLDSIQEITRNVLQRHADGREYAKVVLDVSGVREMRRTALSTFVTDAARTVIDDGVEVAFEVMSSPDRKVVHDTVADIDGVSSASIGEDPRRRVVLRPA